MPGPLRLLFVHGPEAACWRVGFDLAQAAAALDVPVELAFSADGLRLLLADVVDEAPARAARGAYASLELLGIEAVYAPVRPDVVVAAPSALPIRWLAPAAWQSWLRRASVQVW